MWRHRSVIGLAAAIVAGSIFRLIWLRDVEYKADEIWAFTQVQAFWHTHILPPVGVPSSAGLPHPGLNIWGFIAISALLPTIGPLELTRAVQIINIVAIIALAIFVQMAVDRSEREPWRWSVALLSVNPLSVLFSRKLWAQDLLPLFTLGFLAGWWYRRRRWGAFLWGLMGALLGQVHLTGFVFAAAFFLFVLVFDRRTVRWVAWFGGSLVGLVPLLPWLLAIGKGGEPVKPVQFNDPLIPFGDWIDYALGLDLHQPLGDNFTAFLAFPRIYLYPSYLAGALMAGIVAIFVMLVRRLGRRLAVERTQTAALLLGMRSSTSLALNAAFFGYCALLAAMSQPVYLHYMIVASPLPALWVAWMARAGTGPGAGSAANARGLLAALVIAQASLTVLFLLYIHQTQIIHGDYGTAFGSQLRP